MNWYDDNKNILKDLIQDASFSFSKDTLYVEKDYIQSLFLKELVDSGIPFVFKGGTSLTKAFKLISRFSEDIDLSLSVKATESIKKKVYNCIIETANKLGLILTNGDIIKSRYSYNKYIFQFKSLFSNKMQEIIIETSFYQTITQIETKTIHSYLNKFIVNNNINLPFNYLKDFEMTVQTLDRTFVDKVFAICDYKLENMKERDSRHLYDIAKIYPLIKLDDNLDKLIDEVRDVRNLTKNNPSANLKYRINDIIKDIIDSRFFEPDYNDITIKLLYEEYPYDKAINNGLKNLLSTTLFDYKK